LYVFVAAPPLMKSVSPGFTPLAPHTTEEKLFHALAQLVPLPDPAVAALSTYQLVACAGKLIEKQPRIAKPIKRIELIPLLSVDVAGRNIPRPTFSEAIFACFRLKSELKKCFITY
jgi:hypothetical protein